MIDISVIIPCYNVEKYIDRCLDSIVNQTIGIKKLQIIAVDDASTDSTLDRLAEWEKRYPDNILIVACEVNARQGHARNTGVEYAQGEYIFFLDGDDFIEPDALFEMLKCARSSAADVIKMKYAIDCDDEGFVFEKMPGERADVELSYNAEEGNCALEIPVCGNNGSLVGAAGSMYRTSFIKDNALKFPENVAYEDNYWNAVSALYIRRLYIVDVCYYHYWMNDESTVHKRNNITSLDKLLVEIEILETFKKLGYFEKYKQQLFFQFLQKGCLNFIYHIFSRFDYIPIDINKIRDVLWSYFGEYRSQINIDNFSGAICEKDVLKFLVSDEIYTDKMQEEFKQIYMKKLVSEVS